MVSELDTDGSGDIDLEVAAPNRPAAHLTVGCLHREPACLLPPVRASAGVGYNYSSLLTS